MLISVVCLWDLRVSWQWQWWWWFGIWCHVHWLVDARISEKHTVSIFRAEWKSQELHRMAGREVWWKEVEIELSQRSRDWWRVGERKPALTNVCLSVLVCLWCWFSRRWLFLCWYWWVFKWLLELSRFISTWMWDGVHASRWEEWTGLCRWVA